MARLAPWLIPPCGVSRFLRLLTEGRKGKRRREVGREMSYTPAETAGDSGASPSTVVAESR